MPDPGTLEAASPGKGTVLIVDDEEDIRESMRMLLESALPGIRVCTAAGGPEGLRVLEETDGDVRLIISDYRMPEMDGVAFLSEVRRRWPGIQSIMVTAFPDSELAARASREAGVGLFIAKPFDMDQFIAVVRSVLAP